MTNRTEFTEFTEFYATDYEPELQVYYAAGWCVGYSARFNTLWEAELPDDVLRALGTGKRNSDGLFGYTRVHNPSLVCHTLDDAMTQDQRDAWLAGYIDVASRKDKYLGVFDSRDYLYATTGVKPPTNYKLVERYQPSTRDGLRLRTSKARGLEWALDRYWDIHPYVSAALHGEQDREVIISPADFGKLAHLRFRNLRLGL